MLRQLLRQLPTIGARQMQPLFEKQPVMTSNYRDMTSQLQIIQDLWQIKPGNYQHSCDRLFIYLSIHLSIQRILNLFDTMEFYLFINAMKSCLLLTSKCFYFYHVQQGEIAEVIYRSTPQVL